jgi:hypothetical protein
MDLAISIVAWAARLTYTLIDHRSIMCRIQIVRDSPVGHVTLSGHPAAKPGIRLWWSRNDHLWRWSRNETVKQPVTMSGGVRLQHH